MLDKMNFEKEFFLVFFPFFMSHMKKEEKKPSYRTTTSAEDLNSRVSPKLAGYIQQRDFVMQIMTPLYAP